MNPLEQVGAAHREAIDGLDTRALVRAVEPRATPSREVQPQPKTGARPKAKRKPLPPRSAKRIAEGPRREAFREAVLAHAGYRCEGPDRGLPGRCGQPWGDLRPALEVHEPDQRSTHPGSHVRSTLAVALCQVHHDQVTSPVGEMRELALELGLIVKSRS